jgi:hypothetical protein
MAPASAVLEPSAAPPDALRARARAVERILAGAVPVPPWWVAPPFVARVEVIRAQLRPIRSVASLLASYGREAGRLRPEARATGGPDEGRNAPLELAYALRLIELETGLDQAPFTVSVRRAAELRYRDRADP